MTARVNATFETLTTYHLRSKGLVAYSTRRLAAVPYVPHAILFFGLGRSRELGTA